MATSEPAQIERRAMEAGLASLVVGGVIMIMGPPCIMLVYMIQSAGFAGMNHVDRLLAGIGGSLAGIMVLALAVYGIVLGSLSIRSARPSGFPANRGVLGILMNAFGGFVFLAGLIAWIAAVVSYRGSHW